MKERYIYAEEIPEHAREENKNFADLVIIDEAERLKPQGLAMGNKTKQWESRPYCLLFSLARDFCLQMLHSRGNAGHGACPPSKATFTLQAM